MSQVVFRIQPSVRAAYLAQKANEGTSIVSVYNKLNGLETHTSAELVRYCAREFGPLIEHLNGERTPWLKGYRVKIIDGNYIESTEYWLQVLRDVAAGPLPGKSLVVYEPAPGLVTDVFPCEDGHAQERSLFGAVLKPVEAGDLWIEDRNFCTQEFLSEIDARKAFFVTREHKGLPFELLSPLRACGRTPTGEIAQQRVRVQDAQGNWQVFRRLRIKLKQATRDGDKWLYILTTLPRQISAKRVADLYRRRWTLETAFQHLGDYFSLRDQYVGLSQGALFGFCLALVTYNLLAVVLAALRSVYGEESVDQEVSLYYIANDITATYHGMIAIPEPAWDVFYAMKVPELAAILQDLTQRVNLRAFRKSLRDPRKPRPKRTATPKQGHVSTAKLLRS